MKRPMITIDECMPMSENEFLYRDEKLLKETIIDESNPNVDLMGMSDEKIVQKQYEHWDKLGICDELHGEINETLSALFEYHE